MPRENIQKLRRRKLPKAHRSGLKRIASDGKLETKDAAIKEDRYRVKTLRKSNQQSVEIGGLDRKPRKRLRKRLEQALRKEIPPQTAASSLRMRIARKRLIPWLRHLYLTEPQRMWKGTLNPAFVTLLPRSKHWIVPGDQLGQVDAAKLLEQLRSDLTRGMGKPENGWAFFGLHGEYDAVRDEWHIHAHGLVAGEMLDRCEALRSRKKYRSARDGSSPSSEKGSTSVRICREEPRMLIATEI